MASSEENLHELLPRLTFYLDYFQALASLGKALTSNLRVQDVINELMRAVSQLLRPQHWSLLLLDEDKQELYFEIAVGYAADSIKHMRLPLGEGIAGWVAKHQQPLLVPSVADDPRFCDRMDTSSRFHTRAIVCVPLVCRNKTLGVIELVKEISDPEPFGNEQLAMLKPFADFAAIALDNARSFKRIEELTIHDEWTSLYNARFLRTYLAEEVMRARRYQHELSLIFLDLDGFKQVNDRYGHSAGSNLLREVGLLLRAKIRDTDRPVRYGGDEFVVIAPETGKAGAVSLAQRLRASLDEAQFSATSQGENVIKLSASFGAATFPNDADTAEGLLETADRAMYLAKARGRNIVVDAAELLP